MSSSKTASRQQSSSTNLDKRIAATDQSRVVTEGGVLDESLNITDASTHFTDESITLVDSSRTHIDNSDRSSRSYVDNSTHTTLDAEVARSAFDAIDRVAGNALASNTLSIESALKANADTTKLAFDFGKTAIEKTDSAMEKLFGQVGDIAARAQTGATADSENTREITKYALAAAAVIGAAMVLKK